MVILVFGKIKYFGQIWVGCWAFRVLLGKRKGLGVLKVLEGCIGYLGWGRRWG